MPTNLLNTVHIGDHDYLIRKFTAKDGLKIARLVIAKAAPLIPYIDKDMNTDDDVYKAVGIALDAIEDKDLDALIDKCLRVCSRILPAGPAQIIDETGHYGVEDVEYDLGLTIQLCIEAIKWGAADFFGGNASALKQLMARVGSSQNQQTMTPICSLR